MIKFIVAGLWICAASIGAVFFSFQWSGAKDAPEPPPALFGGLDYVKTEVLSVPVLKQGGVVGYFLAQLVYTVEPERAKKLSVPAETLFSDELYTYLFANPGIDFTETKKLDLDQFRNGVREAINKRLGEELIHDVMIEQVDYLSKEEIRNNMLRRSLMGDKKPETGEAKSAAASEQPAGESAH
jgi:hypothetical protein